MGTLRGVLAALAAVSTISCGGPQRGERVTSDPKLEVKVYGPLGSKADAKTPNQAVILGTDDRNGSTILPLPVGDARAKVDALFVRLAPTVEGGMSAVKLTTGPNPDHAVQVGVMEEMVGGAGPQWRAGVWISAIVASTTLNKDLTDFTFSAASSGYIDGASASALMAAGFLAAITGAAIDPAATMTGTINPDGTVGPVAGIPEKFLFSIDKGKKRLGYPIGMRYSKSAKSGEMIDLQQLAKDHKAEAVEIADVHEAYRLLTGKQLPAPIPVPEKDMALDDETSKGLEAKYKQWQQRLATDWATILQLETAGRLPQLLTYVRDQAKSLGEMGESLFKRGMIGAAYARMFAAALYASAVTQSYEILAKVRENKIPDAVALIARHENVSQDTMRVFERLGAMRPPTMGGHMQMLAAFRAALRGWVFESFALQAVTVAKSHLQTFAGKSTAELGSDATADSVVAMVVPTLLYVSRTTSEIVLASEQMEIQGATDINYMCSLPNVKRMATSFQSAGAAGINYFEALLVNPLAEANKMSEEDARKRMMMIESDYLVAAMASRIGSAEAMTKLRDQWGEQSLPWGLMSLAGSQLAFSNAAELIAKYVSLQLQTEESGSGRAQKVEHEKAFANMLATAERTARASARAARIATGTIPVQAKLAYQNALVDRDGSLSDKLDALGQFWASSAYSQTAVMLARN